MKFFTFIKASLADTNRSRSIINYGTRKIITNFIFLQLLTLMVTSFFILKPFMQITSEIIVTKMLELQAATIITPSITTATSGTSSLLEVNNYHIDYSSASKKLQLLPFLYVVREKLEEKLSVQVSMIDVDGQPDFYWFHLETKNINVGFKKSLIGTQPEITMLLLGFFLLLSAFGLSSQISKKLNGPLLNLKETTEKFAAGDFSAKLPKHELDEINQVFTQVNQLTYHFKHLIEQRVIFLSGISHDIRTPITRLSLLLAINENSLPPKFIIKAKKALNEMQALVDIYLNSSQYLLESEQKNTDINKLMEQIIVSLQEPQSSMIKLNRGNNITLSGNKMSETLLPINAMALTRILQNIIANSLKYAPPEIFGLITITTSIDKDKLTIVISDQGKGIPEQHLEEVFKPFYRNKETTDKISGSGLGLSISRQICLSQGWSIKISNKRGTQGLITRIEIPQLSN